MSNPKPIYLEDDPCPFCGTGAGLVSGTWLYNHVPGTYYKLECSFCDCAFDKEFASQKEAVKAWRRRVK